MAIKTTKQQFNQDCTFLGKVDFDQDVVLGRNGEVDGDLKVNGKIINNGLGGKIYQHTVIIGDGNTNTFSFTGYSKKNLKIDSFQDLVTVFGNTYMTGIGFGYNTDLDGIKIGTSATDIYFKALKTSIFSMPLFVTEFTKVIDYVTTI